MVTKVIGDWTEEMALKAVITNPTFIGEIGIGAVNVSETELGLLEGAIEGANKLQIGDVLIQWGTAGAGGGEVTVNFPTAYTSTPFVIAIPLQASTDATTALTASLYSVTTTTVIFQTRVTIEGTPTVVNDVNNAVNHWIAIGINNA